MKFRTCTVVVWPLIVAPKILRLLSPYVYSFTASTSSVLLSTTKAKARHIALFAVAGFESPAIIFIDEIDSLFITFLAMFYAGNGLCLLPRVYLIEFSESFNGWIFSPANTYVLLSTAKVRSSSKLSSPSPATSRRRSYSSTKSIRFSRNGHRRSSRARGA